MPYRSVERAVVSCGRTTRQFDDSGKGYRVISTRTMATVTGVLFQITFATSIPAFVIYPRC